MCVNSKVHIKLSRVQTWLFAVPRLRAMVGANALLGETLRVTLPKLAQETKRGWTLAPSNQNYLGTDENDPLKEHDDPAADAKAGILSRDGGHFEAQFVSGAEVFCDEAEKVLHSKLIGLRFHITINDKQRTKPSVYLSTELPVFAPCEWTGSGLASEVIKQGEKNHIVSHDVAQRHKAAKCVEEKKAVDLASLLSEKTVFKNLKRAQELEELVESGYLALIHADGNSVGSSVKGKHEHERASIFYRNRVLLRRALQKAINTHCPDSGLAPLILLMLGGDDLLLVTRADIALKFVVTLCEELDSLQKNYSGFKLTLGVGVVFAKRTIPIHRLHEVAEQLASSAKRRFRGFKEEDEKHSVVDWAVFTNSWVEDPYDVRQRDWLRGNGKELRVLSQRPVNVLGNKLNSLQGLVNGAELLMQAPRSQLRYLVDQLPRGRKLSELAFAELSHENRQLLVKVGVKEKFLWKKVENALVTELLDLVEISEIGRLGTKPKREANHV